MPAPRSYVGHDLRFVFAVVELEPLSRALLDE